MSTKEKLVELLGKMPAQRLRAVLDFAQFLQVREEQEEWKAFSRARLARAYGPDEPEYTEGDLKSELNS